MEAIFERHTSLRTYVDASLADSSIETVSFGYKLWLVFAKKWNYPRVMQASGMRSALIAAFGCEMASGELNGFAYSANSVKTYKYGVTTTMDFKFDGAGVEESHERDFVYSWQVEEAKTDF